VLRIPDLVAGELSVRRKALRSTPLFLTDHKSINTLPRKKFKAVKIEKMSQAFNNNLNSPNTANSFNHTTTTYNYTTPDDESKIPTWPSPLEPWLRHRDIGAQRVDGIGAWLLEIKEFRRWRNGNTEDGSNHATLFCDGNPGVGKSCVRENVFMLEIKECYC